MPRKLRSGRGKGRQEAVHPLGLFFTSHPSRYFPLAAIAGCNEIRVQIKFRALSELTMAYSPPNLAADGTAVLDTAAIAADSSASPPIAAADATTAAALDDVALDSLAFEHSVAFKECKLRMHYFHLTGPEATSIMNQEHVRLMKMWNGNHKSKTFRVKKSDTSMSLDIDLSFLHPVSELIVTLRKTSECNTSTTTSAVFQKDIDQKARAKNYFAYQGGGSDPNPEKRRYFGAYLPSEQPDHYLTLKRMKLTINGQSQHLDGNGLDRDYLMDRLMPMMHSNTGDVYKRLAESSINTTEADHDAYKADLAAMHELHGRKEIYVYPFCLAPESPGPNGTMNFSKVSHAKLEVFVDGGGTSGPNPAGSFASTDEEEYQLDVYAPYFNWLAIKDGRSLLSFA